MIFSLHRFWNTLKYFHNPFKLYNYEYPKYKKQVIKITLFFLSILMICISPACEMHRIENYPLLSKKTMAVKYLSLEGRCNKQLTADTYCVMMIFKAQI
jgi:hypothetical protein